MLKIINHVIVVDKFLRPVADTAHRAQRLFSTFIFINRHRIIMDTVRCRHYKETADSPVSQNYRCFLGSRRQLKAPIGRIFKRSFDFIRFRRAITFLMIAAFRFRFQILRCRRIRQHSCRHRPRNTVCSGVYRFLHIGHP